MNKSTRREFGKNMLAAGAAGFLGLRCGSQPAVQPKQPIGIQLYTLRDLMKDDFRGTIEKVAAMGYPAVEFAGYGGMTAQEVHTMLDDLGLACAGTHEGFGGLQADLEGKIEFNKAIGNEFIVCPSMPGEYREAGVDGTKTFAGQLNSMGEKIKAADMQFCYHNHAFEFEKADGQVLYDVLMQETDPDLVKAEVDVYWVVRGGVDPVQHIKKYNGRVPLLHMKDMDPSDESFAPVGTGSIDLKAIAEAGKASGTVWYIVEQDRTKRPPLEAVEISLNNLKGILQG